MPLIKCPDCGRDISDTAAKCPYCGSIRTPVNRKIVKAGKIMGSIGLIFYSIFSLFIILILFILHSAAAKFFSLVLVGVWVVWIIVLKKRFL